jgi:hypothetical protein
MRDVSRCIYGEIYARAAPVPWNLPAKKSVLRPQPPSIARGRLEPGWHNRCVRLAQFQESGSAPRCRKPPKATPCGRMKVECRMQNGRKCEGEARGRRVTLDMVGRRPRVFLGCSSGAPRVLLGCFSCAPRIRRRSPLRRRGGSTEPLPGIDRPGRAINQRKSHLTSAWLHE